MSGTDEYADRFVTLRDGLTVPAPAYVLLLSLETRGCYLRRDGDALVVGPSDLLTDTDRVALRRWKLHLLMLLDYCARPDNDAHLFTDSTPVAPASRTA